jgi:PAS domain S-box-containing protein
MSERSPSSRQRPGRAAAEAALADWHALYDSAPIGLCVLDLSARHLCVNRRFLEFTGREASDFLGRTVAEVNPIAAAQTRKLLREIAARGEPMHHLRFGSHRDPVTAAERTWQAHWYPLKDARGRVVAVNVAFEEITDHVATLSALQASESEFRRILENAPVGLGTYNAEGRITFMNPKLTEIVGYRVSDVPLLADWIREAYPDPEYRRAVEAQWAADIARVQRGEMRHSPVREYRLVCRDGSVKHCEITFALGKDGTYAMFNDITGRKQAEAALRGLNAHLEERVAQRTAQLRLANQVLRCEVTARQRLQSQIIEVSEREQRRLGEALHEKLGQQLTALGLMTSVLERELRRDGHPGADSVASLGVTIKESVRSARELSRSFYAVALEQGGLVLALQELAASTQAATGVRCRVRHRAAFHFAAEAAIHLYRIAQEAVTNAVKHAAPREIHLDLTVRHGISILRVANDGRIWRPPRRAASGGLGLPIMRHRADLIGARLTLEPGQPRGCIVTCALPPLGPAPPGAPPTQAATRESRARQA